MILVVMGGVARKGCCGKQCPLRPIFFFRGFVYPSVEFLFPKVLPTGRMGGVINSAEGMRRLWWDSILDPL
jgi:hypothetical protein